MPAPKENVAAAVPARASLSGSASLKAGVTPTRQPLTAIVNATPPQAQRGCVLG